MMPKGLVAIIVFLIIAIIAVAAYLLKLMKSEEVEHKQAKIKKSQIQDAKLTKNDIDLKITESQKSLLNIVAKERLSALSQSEKLDMDEIEILSKLIEKKEMLSSWNDLIDITKNVKTYGILNAAILDHIYKILPHKDKEQETIQTLYSLDCANGGVAFKKGAYKCLPENLDINATLIKILTATNVSNKNSVPSHSIKRACLDLASNGGYQNLNWAAKQVIARTILDNLADDVYTSENFNKKLSDENKIYLRLLAIVLSNRPYEEIIKEFSV